MLCWKVVINASNKNLEFDDTNVILDNTKTFGTSAYAQGCILLGWTFRLQIRWVWSRHFYISKKGGFYGFKTKFHSPPPSHFWELHVLYEWPTISGVGTYIQCFNSSHSKGGKILTQLSSESTSGFWISEYRWKAMVYEKVNFAWEWLDFETLQVQKSLWIYFFCHELPIYKLSAVVNFKNVLSKRSCTKVLKGSRKKKAKITLTLITNLRFFKAKSHWCCGM